MAEKKIVLKTKTNELLIFSKSILNQAEQFEEDKDDLGWCHRYSLNKKIKKKQEKLKLEYIKLEKQLEIYDLENTLKANPLLDLGQLIGGIILSIIGIILIIHIICFKLIKKNQKPIHGFLNDFMLFIEFKIARFFSTIIFIGIGIFN